MGSSRRWSPRRGAPAALLTGLVLFLVPSLWAQDAGPVLLRGQILDASSLSPVPGAFIGPVDSGKGVLTDSLGLFGMRVYPADEYALRVAALGYYDLEMTVTANSAQQPFRLMLSPDPVQLEGLNVLVERLADRRRGVFGVATVLDQAQLQRGEYTSFYDMTLRIVPSARTCSPDADSLCFNNKGHFEPVQVCIDGHRAMGQGVELDVLDPRRFYMVEAYPLAGQIWVYSWGYVARLAANHQELPPLSFGCGGALGGPG